MGLIRESLDVDFYVDPRPLTKEERAKISQHVSDYKEKMTKRRNKELSPKKNSYQVQNKIQNPKSCSS